MIEFKNVSASYSNEVPVLKEVSFTINDGDFVAFAGTNGAGKSTTKRLCNGLLKPVFGEVLIDGVPTTQLRVSELARRVDRPKAVRAVGAANGRNPLMIIVPCHRVIGADGSLTGFGAGIERKRWLLDHETRVVER